MNEFEDEKNKYWMKFEIQIKKKEKPIVELVNISKKKY